MAVKIERDGWSVSGDTVDELVMGIEAVQKWKAHDERERSERSEVLANLASTIETLEEKPKDPYATAIRFLAAIRKHSPATSATIMSVFGIDDAKGLGGLSSGINRTLTDVGFAPTDVYKSDRDSSGRWWTAGEFINEAIDALQAGTGSGGISDEDF